jgi:LysR family nitrogen assimilation transcriptional regulator
MELKQLESFVRVAELGSFTKAAAALGLAQPLLSRNVRQLEVELHQSLLLRNGRGVTLTEAGALLLEHGRGILHQVALAKEELGSVRGALAGRVAIGLPPSLSRLTTVALTLAFRDQLPQAQLTLSEGFSVSMTESLRSGRLDLAVMYNPVMAPDFEMSLLHRDPLVLIAPRRTHATRPPINTQTSLTSLKSKLPLASLAQLPLIVPSRPNAFRLLIDTEMQRLNLKPQIAMEIDGLTAILELVKEGIGYAVLPAYTLQSTLAPQDYVVCHIEKPKLQSELMLVWSAHRPQTSTHRAAMQITQQLIQRVLKVSNN